jgi:hypothetical protein
VQGVDTSEEFEKIYWVLSVMKKSAKLLKNF